MSITLILAVGQDPMILNTRISILRGAGYAVESATSVEEAINHFRSGDFDLIILCHTIPPEERRHIARLIRDSGSPAPVLYVQPLVEPSMDGLADAIIGSHPDELLHGVEEALNKRTVHSKPPAQERTEIPSSSKKRHAIL